MSEKEFELYLTLLSRFLKLSPAQCAAISDELRDHLEERFGELCREGLSREDAIQRALEEFGDATHLASHFSQLSKQRRRRFVMRCTLASVLVGAIAIFTIPAFLPRNAVIDVPGRAVAQQKAKTASVDTQASNSKKTASRTTKPLETVASDLPKSLREKITIEFTETPFADVCKAIQDRSGMQVLIDEPALNEEGISLDEPITMVANDVPLHVSLSWILRPLGLDWRVEHGLLHITTRIGNEDPEVLTSKTYNVRKLLQAGFEQSDLLDTLLAITNGPWEETDGDGGVMDLVGDLISVRHGYHNHREFAALLDAFGKHTDTEATEFEQQSTVLDLAENVEMRDRLMDIVTVNFVDASLSDVAKFFVEHHNVRMRLELNALEEDGVGSDTTITFEMRGKSMATTLKYLLKPIGCTTVVRDAAIWITTKIPAEELKSIVIYDIRDLVTPQVRRNGSASLVDAIINTTSGEWEETDGDGGLVRQPVAWLLAIRQTENVHAEIRRYLENQRAASVVTEQRPVDPEEAKARESEVVTKYYRMEDRTAEDLLKVIPEIIEPFSWSLNGIPDTKTGRIGSIRKVMTGRRAVALPANAIVDSPRTTSNQPGNKPKQLSDKKVQLQISRKQAADRKASKNVLIVPEAVLIIRHTNKTHRKIDKFLKELQNPRMSAPFKNQDDAKTGGGFGRSGGGFFYVPSPRFDGKSK